MTDLTTQDSACVSGSVKAWYQRQIEAALLKLVKHVSVLGYTRNAAVLEATALQCETLEALLVAYESQFKADNNGEALPLADSLLLVEAHQLMAEARCLVRVPLEPVRLDGNVIELRPNYTDLTDAAFERMLASSDIPRFLTEPESWADEDADSNACLQQACNDNHAGKKARPHLRLVHSVVKDGHQSND